MRRADMQRLWLVLAVTWEPWLRHHCGIFQVNFEAREEKSLKCIWSEN